ncbi:MAG: isocitrate/isopropylmalate family dehydrogenase [bacterium]|nr:isocitrate/isopropylmalate family dehydrogenase [bacterium]
MSVDVIERAKEHFGGLLELQLARVDRIKQAPDWLDFSTVSPIIVGIIGGDGIGPYIAKEARWLLEELLKEEISNGKVELRDVEGLTIERRAEVGKPIPDEVLEDIKKCHVTLKGPTTTPRKGDPWPNIESANVALRKELDLFANVRPVRVPAEGIDWVFFRENTEGAYALGSDGIDVTEDLAIDFCAVTSQGTERLIRLAFDYAKKNEIPKVTLVTKANVVKTTDGKFLDIGYRIAEEYPEIDCDDWYIDIMTAKLIDTKRRTDFRVMALPNLYGDILSDEAAEFQGGVGTAGSANIGRVYSMFEAIHGSAPRMVKEGRVQYADPSSMIRAGAMLIRHIGFVDLADKLEMALDVCGQYEKRLAITGRDTGCTGREFAAYIMETIQDTEIEKRWSDYIKAVV